MKWEGKILVDSFVKNTSRLREGRFLWCRASSLCRCRWCISFQISIRDLTIKDRPALSKIKNFRERRKGNDVSEDTHFEINCDNNCLFSLVSSLCFESTIIAWPIRLLIRTVWSTSNYTRLIFRKKRESFFKIYTLKRFLMILSLIFKFGRVPSGRGSNHRLQAFKKFSFAIGRSISSLSNC